MNSLAITIEQTNGAFRASVLGAPDLAASASNRDDAIEGLRAKVQKKMTSGELTFIDIPMGIHALAGVWKDDPDLDEMVREIYRERDLDRERVCAEMDRAEAGQ